MVFIGGALVEVVRLEWFDLTVVYEVRRWAIATPMGTQSGLTNGFTAEGVKATPQFVSR